MAMGGFGGMMGGGKGGAGSGWGRGDDGMGRKRAAMADVLDRGNFAPPSMPPQMPQGMPQRPMMPQMQPGTPAPTGGPMPPQSRAPMPVPQAGPQQVMRRPNPMGAGLSGPGVPAGAVPAAKGQMFGRFGKR